MALIASLRGLRRDVHVGYRDLRDEIVVPGRLGLVVDDHRVAPEPNFPLMDFLNDCFE